MKALILILTFNGLMLCGFAQIGPSGSKLTAAQAAYTKGRYQEALNRLADAERLQKQTTAPVLYLKILVQRALLPAVNDSAFYNHMEQFDKLEVLRENCRLYLSNPVPAKISFAAYQKISQVRQSLTHYPVAKVQFDEIMHLKNTGKQH
ncbi:MAG TPA: hypothetical protein VKB19_07560 [Pedobacter sp.]|nr:hypothetical protein [Pedobacter sp.]